MHSITTAVGIFVLLGISQIRAQQSQFENFSASRSGQGRRVSSQTLGTPPGNSDALVQTVQQPSFGYRPAVPPQTFVQPTFSYQDGPQYAYQQPFSFPAPPPFLTQPVRQPIRAQVNGYVNTGSSTYNLDNSGNNAAGLNGNYGRLGYDNRQMPGLQQNRPAMIQQISRPMNDQNKPMAQDFGYQRPGYSYEQQTRYQVNSVNTQRAPTNFFGSEGRPNYFPNQPSRVNYQSSRSMRQLQGQQPGLTGSYQYGADRDVSSSNARRSTQYGVVRRYNRIGDSDPDLNIRQTFREALSDFQ